MKTYEIEITTTFTIDADSEEEAIKKAEEAFSENPVINMFYIYVNGKPYN